MVALAMVCIPTAIIRLMRFTKLFTASVGPLLIREPSQAAMCWRHRLSGC